MYVCLTHIIVSHLESFFIWFVEPDKQPNVGVLKTYNIKCIKSTTQNQVRLNADDKMAKIGIVSSYTHRHYQ